MDSPGLWDRRNPTVGHEAGSELRTVFDRVGKSVPLRFPKKRSPYYGSKPPSSTTISC
jgi:hypothetical protein